MHGSLDSWARDDLGLALDAEFSISEERARELLAQITAEREAKDRPFMDKPFLILVAAQRDTRCVAYSRHTCGTKPKSMARSRQWCIGCGDCESPSD